MASLGFKTLTVDNWLKADPASSSYAIVTPEGQVDPTPEAWVKLILHPRLDAAVPDEIQSLYEVARGAMAYGYLFYPLYTLAAEQLLRVAETAVAAKCKLMNAPKSVERFAQRIEWLAGKGVIPEHQKDPWNRLRILRNVSSHPDAQTIFAPGDTIGILVRVAEKVNSLFA